MRLITNEFKQALQVLINKLGTQKAVAQKAGISESQIGRWLKGNNEVMHEDSLKKIWPLLKPHFSNPDDGLAGHDSSASIKAMEEHVKYIRSHPAEFQMFKDMSPEEQTLLGAYRKLNESGKWEVMRFIYSIDDKYKSFPLSDNNGVIFHKTEQSIYSTGKE